MAHESGDEYIRRIATYVRNNEQALAAAGPARKRRPKPSTNDSGSYFGWFITDTNQPTTPVKPLVLSFDVHHLFYLLIRMEALGLDVGSLDVKVENPARPMNYVNVFQDSDKSETLSIMSFATTFSAVSKLSLGGSWWGRPPPPSVDSELKFIYSSFTKLPALSLHGPERRTIAELANEPPNENAVPLDAFKNLQVLETVDVDPRTIIGWDRLAESLISLTIKQSGLEDISDVFIGAVLDDQARREGEIGTDRLRRIPKAPPSRQSSFYSTQLPTSVPEDAEDTPGQEETGTPEDTPKPRETIALPSPKWAFLRHLCLADNALTFFPSSPIPYLTSVSYLDLSSNLLVSVPSGLSALYNLVSLNLSDNMIDSVLGIYTMLGGITTLNLAKNRLENICGLERLMALERVDLRHNLIEESAEVGRLATLPNIAEVWVEGNPLTEIEEGYRIRCFDLFWKEGKSIVLDGSPPGFYEKRYLTSSPPEQTTSSRPVAIAKTPPVVPVGSPLLPPLTNGVHGPDVSAGVATGPVKQSPQQSPPTSAPPSHTASPQLAAVRGRKKKNKRIVDLDGGLGSEAGSSRDGSHSRVATQGESAAVALSAVAAARAKSPVKSIAASREVPAVAGPSSSVDISSSAPTPMPKPESSPTVAPRPKIASRHSRHRTELLPPSPSYAKDKDPMSPSSISPSSPTSDDPRVLGHRRSATMSSKSAKRRARISASVFEPSDNNREREKEGEGREGAQFAEAEAFRARIEALRADMGDGWLKVFNQSHLGSASPGVLSG